jgi:hypothetical protein
MLQLGASWKTHDAPKIVFGPAQAPGGMTGFALPYFRL